jgi:23S rRNA (adenine2503-C2)-methyltransferase
VSVDIKSITADQLAAQFKIWGEPAYRANQVLKWLYAGHVATWDAMSNLPKALRQKLGETYTLQTLELVRQQGTHETTQKFLWRLPDGAFIESVLIPASPALYGESSDRHTLCVSTQVGCAYGCKFCASGLDGWKRNLHPFEIVEQVLAVERAVAGDKSQVTGAAASSSSSSSNSGEESVARTRTTTRTTHRLVDNLVIMGMGEPLANYDHLLRALRILNAPWGGGIGARKITISTSGLAPQIRRLAEEPEQFRLAVSLHGATDAVREKIMPVNRRFPLRELTAALEHYQARKGRMLTFEYILIAGVNDGLDQVLPLAALARRLWAKVNLIPYNRVEGLAWKRPEDRVCEAFLAALEKQKISVTLRREKGGEMDAACGQLRLKTEREMLGGKDPQDGGAVSEASAC